MAAFLLGDAAYGVDARQVQEVVKLGVITRVHRAPAEVVGIRNLRGRIVTVLDLRRCLGLGAVIPSADNRVLIVDSHGETVGLLVDAVEDTFITSLETLAPPPSNLPSGQVRSLRGVCRGGGRLVSLLELGVVLELGQPTSRYHASDRTE